MTISDTHIWLERLSSLHRNLMRKAANTEGMQLVHIEILQYLSICNRYSNTAQALSEYLGQTKGSISQSLKFLEKKNLVERKPCTEDKRIVRLYMTPESKQVMKRIEKILTPDIHDDEKTLAAFKAILSTWQKQKNAQGFGQCRSCRFNKDKGNGRFQCGLTEEPLKKSETLQICREHEFA